MGKAFHRARAAAAAFTLLLASTAAHSETEANVSDCLQASAYLDAVTTIEACAPVVQRSDIAPNTLAAANLQIGEALYFYGSAGKALPYLDAAIALDPTSAQAFRRRGWAQFQLKKHTSAIDDFTQFLALSPDDPDAQFALAFVRSSGPHDCEVAAKSYEEILAQHPDHYLSRLSLAAEYACVDGHRLRQLVELSRILSAGREKIADTAYYSRRGRSGPDFYAFVLGIRAGIYDDSGQAKEAMADCAWLIENYPNLPLPYVRRANLRLAAGDSGGALADAEGALAVSPDFPDAQMVRLIALNDLGRDAESVAFANTVLEKSYVSRRTPEIYLYRAMALKRLGRK
jgi:tetratricopeptide (TPR) repeat protein